MFSSVKILMAVTVAAFVFTGLTGTAQAQRDFSKVKIKNVPVTKNITMLMGAGGNIGIVSGPAGVFMIDDQFAPLTPKIVAAVEKITANPIRFLGADAGSPPRDSGMSAKTFSPGLSYSPRSSMYA